jgi:hypothetical protein
MTSTAEISLLCFHKVEVVGTRNDGRGMSKEKALVTYFTVQSSDFHSETFKETSHGLDSSHSLLTMPNGQ